MITTMLYNVENKVKSLGFPQNPEERERQITIIPRDNIPESKNTVACKIHWPKDYPTIADYGELRHCDLLSVFDYVK